LLTITALQGLSRKDKLSTSSVYSGDQVDNQHHRSEENEKTDVPVTYSTAGQSVTLNPWLNVGSGTVVQSRKKNALMVGKDGSAASRATEALRKQKNVKTSQAKLQLLDDARVEIDSNMNQTKTLPLDVDSDDEGDHELENVRKGPKAFSQRDLVAQAFAGDNVVEVSTRLC
jgi:U3 small nucleolar RNA-associated protein 14